MTALRSLLVLLPALHAIACHAGPAVRTGADVLVESRLELLQGRRVGLITNAAGALANGGRLLDTLLAHGVRVTALFSPEHGIGAAAAAGEKVYDDTVAGIPVYSLYGATTRPTDAMLGNVDLLVYHLQDAGVRFYTYLSTMKGAMEAAAAADIPFMVLDRPNPLGGILIDGPAPEDSLRSFVASLPVPVIYGLTCGELARMMNDEGWLGGGARVRLTVIPMEGWTRGMLWRDTGLPWIPPSPNLRSPDAALVYPGTCLLEATNVSEGRGTEEPFLLLGAPFIDGASLAAGLRGAGLPGLDFSPARFTPRASKHTGKECEGVRIRVSDPRRVDPLPVGLALLRVLLRQYPDSVRIDRRTLAALVGNARAADAIREGDPLERLRSLWSEELPPYRRRIEPYLLYGE